MKLKYPFETVQLDDETVAIPVGKGATELEGILRVNETAAFILKQLESDTTPEAITDALAKEYEGDREEIAACVREYLDTLSARGLLM